MSPNGTLQEQHFCFTVLLSVSATSEVGIVHFCYEMAI